VDNHCRISVSCGNPPARARDQWAAKRYRSFLKRL
jgi:hypothetical protein